MKTPSQHNQDLKADKAFLSDIAKGTFLELGSMDGIRNSNTLYFEQKGWDGICIEAHPDLYQGLLENRNCHRINAAVTNSPNKSIKFIKIPEDGPAGLSGIVDNYEPQHLRRIERECKLER